MTTKKLYITSISDKEYIKNKCVQYSYVFRSLYKQFELSSDKEFISQFKEHFHLNDIEYRSLVSEVESFTKRKETDKNNKISRIKDLERQYDELTNSHRKWKVYNKIVQLKKSLNDDVVFGGRHILQQLTKEHNKENKDIEKINKLKSEFRRKRMRSCFVVGESNYKGNRFFDFSRLDEDIIIYKPQRGTKIEFEFSSNSKKTKKDLLKIKELTKQKELPVSVMFDNEFVYLVYDEEKLNGYHLDEKSRRQEVKEIKSQRYPKELEVLKIKECYKKYFDNQKDRKLEGKIKDRCLSIDMNPTNIGWSVLQLKKDGGMRVVDCGVFDLSRLCDRLGVSSNDEKNIHQNNKRKYELTMIVKRLFNIISHYRCSKFVMEDLEFKTDTNQNRESNRKNRNLWCRDLITNCITRRCNESGVELVKVNACYSSFIGNIQHPYSDACNASVEIGRRGLTKYLKGSFYPDITDRDVDTLVSRFGGDVQHYTSCGWVEIFKVLRKSFPDGKDFSHKLRPTLENCENGWKKFSMNSYKSRIITYQFTNL